MAITAIYANLSCADLAASTTWFSTIFGREPDAAPMAGLVEWHGNGAGFQLVEDAVKAGKGTLTLIVGDIRDDYERLRGAGLDPGGIEDAHNTTISRLQDPDGNLVVLAEPN